jgi:vitamin-K-epoxide reductase (warfarin-sensitive)
MKSVILVAAIVGLILSAISLYYHYGTDPDPVCPVDQTWNCDLVNRSIYSEIGGNLPDSLTGVPKFVQHTPVAAVGIAGYLVLIALAFFRGRAAAWLTLLCALFGLAFALRLTYVEDKLLGVWCRLCVGSQAMILLITILAAVRAIRPAPEVRHDTVSIQA